MMAGAREEDIGQGPGLGNLLELPPALARLVHRPERLSAQRLWNALDDGERLTALRILVKRKENRNQLVRIVAEARRFRPATVAGMRDDKVIDMARRVPLDNALAGSLLHMMHLERRREMLARFLDRLDIPNDDGRMQGKAGGDPGEAEVHGAAEDLVREHGLRRAVVYFLTLAIQRVSFAGHLWTWMEGLLARVDAPSQIALGVDGQDDVDLREEPDEQDDPARHRGFTTLDRLLVEAVVDSKQGVVGGLDADEIDDAVDEFVKLNGRRHHSHFHVGLRDVLFDRPIGQDLSASNRNIERWYWTGAIQGWARLERWARIAQAHDANPAVRGLGDGADFATDAGAVYVARALTREARSGEIADFARVEGVVWDPEEVAEARVRCLEARGETLDALVLLQELIHRYVTEGKLDEAEGLLDRIRRYGLDDDYFSDVAGRVSASRAEEEDREGVSGGSKALRSEPAKVLFVGGDERQSRVEDAVRAKVRRRAPHVEVKFIYPGWSGNWSQHLEKVRAQMPGHDALVLMRFMRTELGKQIRKHCDKPWRSCWSSGHKRMASAILAAADAATEAR